MSTTNSAFWAHNYGAGTLGIKPQDLRALAERGGVGRSRICLHKAPEDPAQCMIIYVRAGVCFPVHRHLAGNESYFLVSGRLVLLAFHEDFRLRERTLLSNGSEENDDVCPNHLSWVEKGCWHTMYAEQDSLYVEFRDSPFLPNLEQDVVSIGRSPRFHEFDELRTLAIGASILSSMGTTVQQAVEPD